MADAWDEHNLAGIDIPVDDLAEPAGRTPGGAAPPAADPPRRPRDDSELGFRRKSQVPWFSPKILATTGQRVLISGAMGDFLDKRELQRSVTPTVTDHGEPGGELWMDFVADTGDGFNSTYSIAWLTSQKQLEVEGLAQPLPRAGLLVLGGDEVYPAAAPDEYDNRFKGPYAASFPFTRDDSPRIFAIPGNHDWYDGLTNFMRLFCRRDGKHIGARLATQSHSYFAVRLPHNWWLWGIDIQFDSYIDDPQLQFFEDVASTMTDESRIILCTGKPSWTDVQGDPAAFRNLGYFQSRVITPSKAKLLLSISGDSHHYARYDSRDGTHKITAGGGGAFLHPTHHLDDPLDVPVDAEGKVVQRYNLCCRYPSSVKSRLLSAGALKLPIKSPTFMLVPAVIYLILGWATQFAARTFDADLAGPLDEAAPRLLWFDILFGLVRNPLSVLVLVVVLGGLIAFAKPSADWSHGLRKMVAKILLGSGHLALQLGVGVILVGPAAIWVASAADGFWFNVLLIGALMLLGGLGGALAMGAYLALTCAGLRAHGNEAFSAMASTSYKNFLRLHINRSGVLTIYPIGLDHSTKDWTYDPDNSDIEAPWLAPGPGKRPVPRLIEEQPVMIDPRLGASQ